jgi:hypothetical protein
MSGNDRGWDTTHLEELVRLMELDEKNDPLNISSIVIPSREKSLQRTNDVVDLCSSSDDDDDDVNSREMSSKGANAVVDLCSSSDDDDDDVNETAMGFDFEERVGISVSNPTMSSQDLFYLYCKKPYHPIDSLCRDTITSLSTGRSEAKFKSVNIITFGIVLERSAIRLTRREKKGFFFVKLGTFSKLPSVVSKLWAGKSCRH